MLQTTANSVMFTEVEKLHSSDHNIVPFYFGGARSKGFATLRNVSKLQFFGKIGHAKAVGFIRLFDEVRAELVRVISRSLRFL